jgi:NitT/TauT family transport system ATP-binding protein
MSAIELRNLCKTYTTADGRPLPVLDDLSMTVAPGEFVCILGPSGSGKSTTLDVLAGLTQQDQGEVLVDGRELRSRDTVFGYVFQRPRLLNWRSVAQNLEFALEAHGVPRARWRELVDQQLEVVGLSQFRDAYPLTLSGGMQQRTAIARALIIEPSVLLMDEPFSALDELTARHLRRELVSLWSRLQSTVLFVTHNAMEAAYLADRVVVVSDRPARVVADIPVEVPRPRTSADPDVIAVQQQVITALESGGSSVVDGEVESRSAPEASEIASRTQEVQA